MARWNSSKVHQTLISLDPNETVLNLQLSFGKYRGQTIGKVMETPKGYKYIKWVNENFDYGSLWQKVAERALEDFEANQKSGRANVVEHNTGKTVYDKGASLASYYAKGVVAQARVYINGYGKSRPARDALPKMLSDMIVYVALATGREEAFADTMIWLAGGWE